MAHIIVKEFEAKKLHGVEKVENSVAVLKDGEVAYQQIECKIRTSIWISKKHNKEESLLILEQIVSKKDQDDAQSAFKLFSSKNESEVMKVFQQVKETIQPVSGVPLSLGLLRIILLPDIKPIQELPSYLLKYIQTHSATLSPLELAALANVQINDNHLIYACQSSNAVAFKILHSCDYNILTEDPTKILHTATQVSPDCLHLIIEGMHNFYTAEQIIHYLSKPNSDHLASDKLKILVRTKSRMYESAIVSKTPFGFLHIQNKGGITPLMVACINQVILSVVYLLIEGADPNVQDPGSGNTALHIAVSLDNHSIVQALLAYNADMAIANSDDVTPFQIAEHIHSKSEDKQTCHYKLLSKVASTREMATQKEYKETASEIVTASKEEVFLLSLDGGGTRAVIAVFTLHYIQNIMREISGQPQLSILDYFNWLAGTSAGSIVTSCIAYYNEVTTNKIMQILICHKNEIFSGSRIYDPEPLVQLTKRYVDESRVNSITEPRVLITTVQADISPPKLVLITNYREDSSNRREWRAWEAVRASTAAPTYFPSFEGKYVDGGVLAVNPTLNAMSDIHRYDDRKLKFVLSLGTGVSPEQHVDSVDLVIPKLSLNLVASLKANVNFISGLMNILTAGANNMEGPIDQAQDWCEAIGASYHRFSTPLSKALALDTKNDSDIVLLIYDAYIHCLECDDELHDIAVTLLKHGPITRQ